MISRTQISARTLTFPFLLAVALTGTTLRADIVLTQGINQFSYGNGGEFRAVTSPSLDLSVYVSGKTANVLGGGGFQTFCIEYNEEFYPGTHYNFTMSDRAMYGSMSPEGDPISIGTAYLYYEFARGTLSGYNYDPGSGRVASAGDLQKAIWWLEGENNGVNNSFVLLAENALSALYGTTFDDVSIKGDAHGAFGVYALNLGTAGVVQDQLYVMAVPEPATIMAGGLFLLPFGISTVRILRRKQRA